MLNGTESTTKNDVSDEIARTVQTLRSKFDEELKELEEKLRLARGTEDVTEKAKGAVQAQQAPVVIPIKPEPKPLVQQIEQLLRQRIMTTEELSRATGTPADKVLSTIKGVRSKVANLGAPDRARWSWRIGSDVEPSELRALVERLISFAPMEFREVVNATGARQGLIQGHLVEIRKTHDVLDLGGPGRARWFMVPTAARNARITRKRRPTSTGAKE